MPAQRTAKTTTKTTPPSRPPANGGRKPNGGANGPKPSGPRTTRSGGNGKPNTAWPVSLILAAEVEIAIEGEDAAIDGFSVCTRCGSILPGSEVSRGLHARFHELVDGIDQRAG
jgi:hypothetical protein